MAKALSLVAEAYERCKEVRNVMYELNGRQMECTEDKAGIVWERFLMPWGESVILVATPHWWDLFAPVSPSANAEDTFRALRKRKNVAAE